MDSYANEKGVYFLWKEARIKKTERQEYQIDVLNIFNQFGIIVSLDVELKNNRN